MPKRATHAVVGVVAGGVAAVIRADNTDDVGRAAETLGGVIGGLLGGILPDLLEPAMTPNHRQLAHSAVAGGALGLARVAEWQAACRHSAAAAAQRATLCGFGTPQRAAEERAALVWRCVAGLLVGAVAGYVSHLALDACTPRGLPLVGRVGIG